MKKATPRRPSKSSRRTASRMAKNRKATKRVHGELRKKRGGRLGY